MAIGFGLRQQAVADKQEGLPIDYVDPAEGNFSLQEAAAVIDKGDKTKADAAKMVECIIKNGRADLLKSYPNPIYESETSDSVFKSANPKTFAEKLSVDLLKNIRSCLKLLNSLLPATDNCFVNNMLCQ